MAALTLLFPPATDPRSPHLALPSLTAHLRAHGEDVAQRDLDLEGFLRTVAPGSLEAAARRLRDAPLENGDADTRQLLLADADHLIEHTDQALATLRDPHGFHDPHRHHAARSRLSRALELVSASGPVTYRYNAASYDVEGIDASKLVDLERVTADPTADVFGALHDEVAAELAASPPELVGISILNRQQIIPGLTLARRLKAGGHPVVIGGTVYAKFADRLRRRPRFFELFCDFLVPYEGETALVELLGQLRGDHDFARVPNVLFLQNGEVLAGPTHVEDMRLLPTPDFSGLPLDKYLTPEPVLPILTGKGCYFNRCKFCDIPAINEISVKPYRVRGADQIAADCAALRDRFGARHFEITDETLSPKLLLKLADALEAHPDLDPRFVGYARFEPGFTAETCERIYAMGMRKVFFGLESGSQRMLDHMDKGVEVDVAREVLRNCASAGLAVHLFSIIGFPEETEADARETVQFLLDEAGSITAAQNSFDVHPFGLDLRTDYFDSAADIGVDIDLDHLAGRDFPISVAKWVNRRGLASEDVTRLIDEFTLALRAQFAPQRWYPAELWPGFEEYAVLYASWYESRPWAYRFALPDPDDDTPVQLMWAEGVQLEPIAGGWAARADGAGWVPFTEALLHLLAKVRPPTPTAELLDTLAREALSAAPLDTTTPDELSSTIRDAIGELLAARVLWLVPTIEPASAAMATR